MTFFSGRTALAPLLLALFLSVLAMLPAAEPAGAKPPFTLDEIHKGLLTRYKDVAHISPLQLQKALTVAKGKNILLLDVREQDEFAVSHIKGARRVDPGIWHSSFLKKFAALARDKTVVVYCSVGERSSKLAAYVQKALLKTGARAVYNLQGGIFKWHNDQRPGLVSNKGPTAYVHPYNKYWGQLLKRRNKARYTPQ